MSFKSEVDAEAAKLIEQGVPPLEALKQAVQIVSKKHSAAIAQSEGDEYEIVQKIKEES